MPFKRFLLKLILAFVLGCVSFYFVASHTSLQDTSTPWFMLTLLLIPSTYCVQAFFKLPEVNEHPSLSSSELRRLKPIIKIKKRRLTLLFCYYLFAAATLALAFFSFPIKSYFFSHAFTLTGGLLISSLYSFVFIKDNMDEIQAFKSMLIHRAETEKSKKELLKKITKEPD
ncbi:hypothetical protein SNN58_001690 [Cronobacter dublinensis]|nr:hypothetical protein [Cronobacter dublinensis]ELY3971112.1 hypothetical protein [Cronobacter dublinensis]ELY4485753.1 hypothetical protein [Cronobacter dublinensis]ELY5823204.1 hypothetical protein [Cronobacter dublinensis]